MPSFLAASRRLSLEPQTATATENIGRTTRGRSSIIKLIGRRKYFNFRTLPRVSVFVVYARFVHCCSF